VSLWDIPSATAGAVDLVAEGGSVTVAHCSDMSSVSHVMVTSIPSDLVVIILLLVQHFLPEGGTSDNGTLANVSVKHVK
jgi:hypothetical protein